MLLFAGRVAQTNVWRNFRATKILALIYMANHAKVTREAAGCRWKWRAFLIEQEIFKS